MALVAKCPRCAEPYMTTKGHLCPAPDPRDERIAELEREFNELHDMHVKVRTERDAYKRAKEENDERYMIERDEARAERDRLAGDALAALSGAGICTPEAGYVKEPHVLAHDIEALAKQRDQLQADNARLRADLENAKTLWARSIEQVCEEQTEALRLREALEQAKEFIECIPNHLGDIHGHAKQILHVEHFVQQALAWIDQAQEAHSSVGNADAPAPPDTSMKQEKSDTLAGPVDAGDTSASCSETAGTKPTCAPSQDNFPGIRCTPEQVRCLEDVARAAGWMKYPSPALAMALAALRDSGWRG